MEAKGRAAKLCYWSTFNYKQISTNTRNETESTRSYSAAYSNRSSADVSESERGVMRRESERGVMRRERKAAGQIGQLCNVLQKAKSKPLLKANQHGMAAAYKSAQMKIPPRQPTPHGSEGACSQACESADVSESERGVMRRERKDACWAEIPQHSCCCCMLEHPSCCAGL
ncbi:MAG: hypothetical protein L6R38_001825 [Xanthoria sp. 2 TBL-2021]|nr:MAG: hypothetical protein L6R38_001825 [Xanthoria sp. 2 TBL-2021]